MHCASLNSDFRKIDQSNGTISWPSGQHTRFLFWRSLVQMLAHTTASQTGVLLFSDLPQENAAITSN
jgi:hypothetical protein